MIIQNYLNEPNAIMKILVSERRRYESQSQSRCDDERMHQSNPVAVFGDRMCPQAKGLGQPVEAGKSKGRNS